MHLNDISHKGRYGHRGWGHLRYCCFTMEPHQARGPCQQHIWFLIRPKDHRETHCHQREDVCSNNAGNKTSLKKSWQILKGIINKCKYRSVVQQFRSNGIILRTWTTNQTNLASVCQWWHKSIRLYETPMYSWLMEFNKLLYIDQFGLQKSKSAYMA